MYTVLVAVLFYLLVQVMCLVFGFIRILNYKKRIQSLSPTHASSSLIMERAKRDTEAWVGMTVTSMVVVLALAYLWLSK